MLPELIAAFLVLLFLYTTIMKLRGASRFVGAMQHNPLLYSYAETLGWLIPVTELLIVSLLIIPHTRRLGLLAATLIMAAFTGYIAYMLAIDSTLPCTCGGVLETWSWRDHLWFNSLTTLASLAATLIYPQRFVATNRRSRTPVKHSRQQLNN